MCSDGSAFMPGAIDTKPRTLGQQVDDTLSGLENENRGLRADVARIEAEVERLKRHERLRSIDDDYPGRPRPY